MTNPKYRPAPDAMTGLEDLRSDIDQHEIAERILLNLLRLTLENPEAMSRSTVAGMLAVAAEERERQGDYLAATLLDKWATLAGRQYD